MIGTWKIILLKKKFVVVGEIDFQTWTQTHNLSFQVEGICHNATQLKPFASFFYRVIIYFGSWK